MNNIDILKTKDDEILKLYKMCNKYSQALLDVKEYITSEEYFELNNYMSASESQNRANYFKAQNKLLEIVNQALGSDNNE